jgi:tetratricopeptide (TPR) repeat protein
MVLPLPRGRSQRVFAVSLHVAERRQRRRQRQEERRLLAPSRELFQRAHVVVQMANRALAASLFEQCIAALPTKRRDRTRPAVRVIRAMALTQLGQLAEASEGKAAAARHYTASVATWSGQSEAHYWLAQEHLAAGQLDDAERLLRNASVEMPARLGGVDDALLQEQRDRAAIARYDLALLLAQRGGQREASTLARDLGFGYRLSAQVLCPGTAPAALASRGNSATGLAHVVDGGVPQPLLSALRAGFAPSAPFWNAHRYGQAGTGYFSYCYPVARAPSNIVEAYIAHALRPQLVRCFPQLAKEGVIAEWWLHSRAHTAGHQLHYDTDEQRLRRGDGVHCPAVSTVLYLEAGGGSPTMVAEQRFGEPLAGKHPLQLRLTR